MEVRKVEEEGEEGKYLGRGMKGMEIRGRGRKGKRDKEGEKD